MIAGGGPGSQRAGPNPPPDRCFHSWTPTRVISRHRGNRPRACEQWCAGRSPFPRGNDRGPAWLGTLRAASLMTAPRRDLSLSGKIPLWRLTSREGPPERHDGYVQRLGIIGARRGPSNSTRVTLGLPGMWPVLAGRRGRQAGRLRGADSPGVAARCRGGGARARSRSAEASRAPPAVANRHRLRTGARALCFALSITDRVWIGRQARELVSRMGD